MIKELIETYPSVSLYKKKTRNIKKNRGNREWITSNTYKK